VGFEMRKKTGTRDRGDIWLHNLSMELNRACDLFWTRTEERREIEFRRRSRGFFDRNLSVEKTPSRPENPDT
jgi:hypothetical protein